MWAQLRPSEVAKDGEKQLASIRRSLNLNEEYFVALRTESYTEFSSKAQRLVGKLSSPNLSSEGLLETLLEPKQDLVPTILEVEMLPKSSGIKHLMFSYFDATAEASQVCCNLLISIHEMHFNYEFLHRAKGLAGGSSSEELESMISELCSFDHLCNPFSSSDKGDIVLVRERCSSLLHRLKSERRRASRRIKLVRCLKKAFGVCLTALCSMFALVAAGVAVHSVAGLLLGPALIGFLPLGLQKKRLDHFKLFRNRCLRKLVQQLDVAAKGAYILSRDFDTISRLVARLRGDVEHDKAMIKLGLERKDENYTLQQVVKELKKGDEVFRKQLEELEEHVYLCLVTINRARTMLMKEMTTPCLAS